MLIRLVDELVISEAFNYDRFGEVVVAEAARRPEPAVHADGGGRARGRGPGAGGGVRAARITIDDLSVGRTRRRSRTPATARRSARTTCSAWGDTITGVTGVVDHTFGVYRLQPTQYGAYAAANPRPADAPAVGGDVQVASFNVLNYFLTLDPANTTPLNPADNKCGPGQNVQCRGANTQAEFQRQRAKILTALTALDADVVGLMEMENTPGVEPAADLVNGLNEHFGAGTYDYIDTGVIGTDAIRLGLLYKPGVVRPAGGFAVLDSSVDSRFLDTRSRPMLTQTFDEVATDGRFTVSVNHLKSKGSACAGDPDTGDGSGNCNITRTQAAEAIVDFLAGDPTESGDPDHLVIGDLNSYDHEDPIDALVAGGFADQIKRFGGEHAYGYVFDGQVGYLDHALANGSLAPQVTGATEWHITPTSRTSSTTTRTSRGRRRRTRRTRSAPPTTTPYWSGSISRARRRLGATPTGARRSARTGRSPQERHGRADGPP
jgi:predicted extracellular nuclease